MPKAGIGTVGLHPFLDHPTPHLGTSLGGAGHIDEVLCRAVAPTSRRPSVWPSNSSDPRSSARQSSSRELQWLMDWGARREGHRYPLQDIGSHHTPSALVHGVDARGDREFAKEFAT